MAVVPQKSLSVCNAQGFAVSRFSQADAAQRCLSAYRASEIPLADGRLFQKRQSEGKADSVVACSSREQDIVVDIDIEASDRASQSLESLRRKRLRRNKKKREAIKMMYMFILFTNYRYTTAVWCFSGRKPYQLVLQFHGIDGICVTFNKATQSGVRDQLDWVSIFKETAEALDFMHKKGFLHNDLKSDNILLSQENNAIHLVIIEFGKCHNMTNPKRYSLTAEEQKKYKKYHRHIAPELVKGTHSQSFKSYIYSHGYLLSQMSKSISRKFDDVLADISIAYVRTDPVQRPTLTAIIVKLK